MATHRGAELARAAKVIGGIGREMGLLTGAPGPLPEWETGEWVEPARRESLPLEEAA
jgi:hypothetical protein